MSLYFYYKESKLKKGASVNIHNFAHKLRNLIIENTTSTVICDNNEFKSECESLCQEIYDYIKNDYKKESTVTIKLLKPWTDKADEDDILNTEVYDLCCAGIGYRANMVNNISKVSDYTAFSDILLCRRNSLGVIKTTFACSNLVMLKKTWKIMDKEEYKGTPHHYKSTVIVPIRVASNSSDIPKDECYKGYKTYGFICVDCKKTCSKDTKEKMVDYICSFADYLCVYFANAYDKNFYKSYLSLLNN